jgi:hypothetical protein
MNMATMARELDLAGVSPYALALRHACTTGSGRTIGRFEVGQLDVEVGVASDSVWAFVRREGQGGLAIRAPHVGSSFEWTKARPNQGEAMRLSLRSALGEHTVVIRGGANALEHMRVTVSLPSAPTLFPFVPRDLYPLGAGDDPLGADGCVEAGQRGLNAGLVYFRIDEPPFGNVLYLQNLTALNSYFEATKTKPDGAVGGVWPELGYLMPTNGQGKDPQAPALEAGVEVTLSDAIVVFRHEAPPHERESARQFLQMLGVAYRQLDLPACEYRDWIDRSQRTLRDLDRAPEATIRHYGYRYIHPYTAAEYPDIMVQMSLVAAIHDWGKWCGEPHPLEAEFKAGLHKFYDPKLGTLRRYLPNVGDDKDPDAVDSWYLYHPPHRAELGLSHARPHHPERQARPGDFVANEEGGSVTIFDLASNGTPRRCGEVAVPGRAFLFSTAPL